MQPLYFLRDITPEQLAPGVWHHAVHLIEGPWAIHVVEIDLDQAWPAGVRLQTAQPRTAVDQQHLF